MNTQKRALNLIFITGCMVVCALVAANFILYSGKSHALGICTTAVLVINLIVIYSSRKTAN